MTRPDGVTLRPAVVADAARMVRIGDEIRRVYGASQPFGHELESKRKYILDDLLRNHDVTVALLDGSIVGYVAFQDDRISELRIDPSLTGRGIGSTLIEHLISKVSRVQVSWEDVTPGERRFFHRHGFREVQVSEGDNEEGHPDICFLWESRARKPSRSSRT